MKIKIALLLFLATSYIYAQNSLTGNIQNSETNEGIAFANVYFPELEKGTISDDTGGFGLNNIPNGRFTIVVTSLGFKTFSKELVIDSDLNLEVLLEPSAIEIDEIILSTPFNQLQSDNVMKVESIKLNNIRNYQPGNLTNKLTQIPGVSTVATGNGIGKPVIRGISGNRVLTYTQGVRLENFQSGEKHGLGINEKGIESVEIIKGPASLLYGSDALGGVIYLVPEKYELENKTSANFSSAYQSNTIGFSNSLGVKSTFKNLKTLARFTYDTQSDYETPENERVTNTRFNNADLKLGVGFDAKKFTTDVRYNFNHAKNGIAHGIDEQTTSKDMDGIHQDLKNHYLSVKNNVFLKPFTIKSTLGFTSHNRRLLVIDQERTNMLLNTFNYHIKFNLPKEEKLKTVFGIQGMSQTNENRATSAFLPDASIFDFGVFGTTNWKLDSISSLQFGARYDYRNLETETFTNANDVVLFADLSKDYNNFSSSLGFKSSITKKLDYRLNLALGYRAPNLSELFSDGIHEGKYEIGNQNLDTENNFQSDLSLEYESKNFELFANVFYNKISNYIYLLPTGDEQSDLPVFQYQQDNSSLYGGEFGMHFHPTKFDWLGFKTSGEYVRGKVDDGDNLPRIPGFTNKNTFHIDMDNKTIKNGFVSLNNTNVFKQENVTEDESNGEAYQLVGLAFGSDINISKSKLTWNISIDNLFNEKYIDHLSVLKEDDILNIGRSFNFGINYQL